MLIAALISVILASAATATAFTTENHEKEAGIVIQMPGVRPTLPDTYICAGLKLGDTPTQVIGYDPLFDYHKPHHMNIYACEKPGSKAPVWNCGMIGGLMGAKRGIPSGPKCARGHRQFIYAWTHQAPPMHLPKGVGIKLPANTMLVLQVHYANVDKFVRGETTDNTGVRLLTTEAPLSKLAGAIVLQTDGVVPKYSVTYLESSCKMKLPEGKVLHPFAFAAHTHKRGRVVSGYRVRRGNWTEIGRGNPRRPQTLYDLTGPKDVVIRNGDFLAARCTMYNRHNTNTREGLTINEEMCQYFVAFWVDGELPYIDSDECWASGTTRDNWATKPELKSLDNMPLEVSKQPPLGSDEEEVWKDPPEYADKLDQRGTLSEDDPKFVLQTADGGRIYLKGPFY